MSAITFTINDIDEAFETFKKIFEMENGKQADDHRFLIDDVAADVLEILRRNQSVVDGKIVGSLF